jgi:molybdate transport system ATP-binding protein
MDEPLASLDEARKTEILPYLARLKNALGLPILYVTHALDEVSRLADTLVLIENGRSQAAGPLTELAGRGDLPIAARDDASAILHAPITRHDTLRRLSELDLGGQPLLVPLLDVAVGATMRLRIPARDVILAQEVPRGISLHNVLSSHVRAITEHPARHASLVELVTGPANLLARITPDAVSHLGLAPGRPVLALIKSTAIEPLGVEAGSLG